MAHSKLFVFFALCMVVSTLLVPTQAVNRLFVDKISGYHQELVVAQDIEPDLLRTTQMIVGAGVDVNSIEDHVIDTRGPIALNGSDLDIEAVNDIDITSFGGNVRFAADSVGVSANAGGTISAVEATVNANNLDLSYQTFEVDGAQTTIRSLNDISITGTDMNISALDAVEILASSVDITGDGDFRVVSDQSNVVVDAGKDVTFTATAGVTVTGQSGVDIISFHDDLTLSSTVGDATFTGENTEIRGLHTVGLNAGGDASFSAGSFQTVAGTLLFSSGDDMVWTADGSASVFSQGSANIRAQDLIVSGADVQLFSGNDLSLLSAGNADFSATSGVSVDATDAVLAAGDDVTVDVSGALDISAVVVDVNSDASVLFNASPAGISLTAADHADLTAADGALTVQADNFNVNFGETADFQAANDLTFRSNGDTAIAGTDSLIVTSRVAADLQATGVIDITSDGLFSAVSNQDIELTADGALAFSADFANVNGQERVTVDAVDDVTFTVVENFSALSAGDVSLSAADSLIADAPRVGVIGRDVVLGLQAGQFTVSADEIVLDSNVELEARAGNAMSFSSQEDIVLRGGDFDISSINGNVNIEADDGDVVLDGDNFLFSSIESTTIRADNEVELSADTIFIYQEVTLTADDIDVQAGDFVITSVVDRDASITVEGDPITSDIDNLSSFIGGSITFDFESIVSTAENHFFRTNNGFDMTVTSADTITFDAGDIVVDEMPFIQYLADSYTGSSVFDSQFSAVEALTLETSAGSIAIDADDFRAEQFANIGFGRVSGDNGVALNAVNGDFSLLSDGNIVQTADTTIEYFAFQSTFDINTNGGTASVTADTASYSSPGGSVLVDSAAKQTYVGTTTTVDVGNNMDVTGDTVTYFSTGLTSFTAGNDFIADVTGDHTVSGGSLDISGGTDVIFNVDSFVVTATVPSTNNVNQREVNVESGGDIALTGAGIIDFYAFGNNPYVDEAITMVATGGATFTAENANFISFVGDNGINMTAANTAATSQSDISFLAHMGGFLADTFIGSGAGVSLLLESFDHDPVTPSSATRVEASGASVLLYGNDIEVDDGFFAISGDAGVTFQNYQENDMTYESVAGAVTASAGGNIVVDGGARLSATTAAGLASLSFGTGVLIHSTADQNPGQAVDQIVFSGRSPAPSDGFVINVGGDFHAYPSGDFVIAVTDGNTPSQSTFQSGSAGLGFLKVGSETGGFSFASGGDVTAAATANIELFAHGVDGHVNYESDATYTSTAAGEYTVNAAYSGSFAADDWTITAATGMDFTASAETEGIAIGNTESADNIEFIANLPAGSTDGLVVSGHFVDINAGGDLLIDAAVVTVGENNQPHNPVVQMNIASLAATSVGTSQFTVANNDFVVHGDLDAVTTDGGNILLTSGGDQIYSTTFATGVPDSALFTLSAGNGDAIFIADDTIEAETGDGVYSSDNIILQTQGSNTASSFVATSNYNIEFDGDVVGTVATSARFVTGAVDVDVLGDTVTIGSSAGTLDITSSHELLMGADSSIELSTDANNAGLTFSTQGPNSDLIVGAFTAAEFEAVDGDINVSGDRTRVFSDSSLLLEASSANNGKLQMEASRNVGVSATDILFEGDDSIYFDAVGEDSTVDVHVQGMFISGDNVNLESNAGEGGSIIFSAAFENAAVTFTTDFWDVESDRDLLVESRGFFVANGAEYDVSAGRSGVIVGDDVELSSTAGPVAMAASAGSIRGLTRGELIFEAPQDDMTFTAGDGVIFTSAEVDGSATVSVTGEANLLSAGSFEAVGEEFVDVVASDIFSVSATGPIDIVSTHVSGDIVFIGDRLDLSGENVVFNATGSITGTTSAPSRTLGDQTRSVGNGGFMSISNLAVNSRQIDVGFNVAYWNFYEYYEAPSYEFDYENIWMQDSRNNAQRDVISNVHDSIPRGIGERDYWYNGADLSSDSLNIFKGAQELAVHAETGDVRFHYAEDLLVAGTQISGISSGGMVVRAYGQGRRTVAERDLAGPDATLSNQAIQFADLSSLAFRTNVAGDGSLTAQAKAGSVDIFTEATSTFRTINEDLVFSAEGTLTLIHESVSNGVDFNSASDLTITAFDDDVRVLGEDIGFSVLGTGSLSIQTAPGAPGLVLNTDEFTTSSFDVDNWTIVNEEGDIVFTSPCVGLCGAMSFTAESIDIVSGHDIAVHYADTLNLEADFILISTGEVDYADYVGDYSTTETGVVRFDGRSVTDHTGSDQADVVKPTVFFSDELIISPPTPTASLQGMYCAFERSFAPQLVNYLGADSSFCICLDHTWSCKFSQEVSVTYFVPENPYDGSLLP